MDDELNIDPRETDYFDDYDMEKMAIFFDLQAQLADLGFDDPALIGSLRQRINTTEQSIFTVNYKEIIGGNEFRAWFELEQKGSATFTLAHYEAMLSVGPDDLHRLFAADISREEAIDVLKQDQKGLLPDEEVLRPMSRTQVNTCLQLLGSPEQAIEQFKAVGLYHWNDPETSATLALPHGLFYQADEYLIKGRRLLTELELGGNNHRLTFKQFTARLLPIGFHGNIDNELYLPLSDLVPEHTISQSYGKLEQLNTIYEQLKKQEIMNTQNLSYLQKQLLNLGFGEKMNAELEKQIVAKSPEFTLATTQEYNKQNVDYKLHYKAGDKEEMYFFNKYDASMEGKEMQQSFYINKGSGITAKEAYNLMDGRAVHKQLENLEGVKYNAWLILDKENKTDNGNYKLRPFTENWNYKPERAIDKMDIVGINEDGAREKLMKSLEKGNRHQITALKDGKEVKLYLEANPAEHRVNLTNYKGEAQQLEHYKKPEFKNEQKKDQKQAQAQEDAPAKKPRKGAKMKV